MTPDIYNRSTAEVCLSEFRAFGYEAAETAAACARFYLKRGIDEIEKDVLHVRCADSNCRSILLPLGFQSYAIKLAIENTRAGGTSFVAVFGQKNHTKHSNDLSYFFGLHPIVNITENDRLMNAAYPRLMRRFIKGARPIDGN